MLLLHSISYKLSTTGNAFNLNNKPLEKFFFCELMEEIQQLRMLKLQPCSA